MSKLVLFDLDGTLADSAPDLAATANLARERRGLPPLPYLELRPYSTQGARGLLKAGLNIEPGHPEYDDLRQQFLNDYEQRMGELTTLFEGVHELLDRIQGHGFRWGIVTNKLEYLARPVVEHLGLATGTAVVVGGDTTPHAKPHPAPLLHAANQAGFHPGQCIYIGDDQRDILAGKAAGMATLVAAYGYGTVNAPYPTWEADGIAENVPDLWPLIQRWAGV